MLNYTGCKCPVCKQPFSAEDDVVVCPDCGAPYHRSCWQQQGACSFAAKHGPSFSWEPDPEDRPAQQAEGIVCPGCGQSNPAGSRFCNHCGHALTSGESTPPPHAAAPGYRPAGSQAPPQGQNGAFANGPYVFRQELGPEDAIDGIKAKDWAAYVGTASPFYLLNFLRLSKSRSKIAVSFGAFCFGPLYFFYRKAWKPAVCFTLLSLVLTLPSLLNLMYMAGAIPWLEQVTLFPLIANIAYYLSLAMRMFCGFFAVSLYKQDAAQKIGLICQEFPEGEERTEALTHFGGTSVKAVVLYIAVYLVALLAFSAFLTQLVGTEGILQMANYLYS